jgi:hypothetical protein
MREMPSLVGPERARIEDFNWASGMFSWAIKELRVTQSMAASDPDNQKLRIALINTEEAIWYQLENWEPSNGPN